MTVSDLLPDAPFEAPARDKKREVLLIACGALAREMLALIALNQWDHVRLLCLPAILHNHPERIAPRLRALLDKERRDGQPVFIAYSDCGSGGEIQRLSEEVGADFLGGAHCYQIFCGAKDFATLADEEPGTFYLTDFLARHFSQFVIRGLGLDRHPSLKSTYFANYKRLVYLAQTDDRQLQEKARRAADYLQLAYTYRFTGYDGYNAPLSASLDR